MIMTKNIIILILSLVSITQFVVALFILASFVFQPTYWYRYDLSDGFVLEEKCISETLEVYDCEEETLLFFVQNDVSDGEVYIHQNFENIVFFTQYFDVTMLNEDVEFNYVYNSILKNITLPLKRDGSSFFIQTNFISKTDIKHPYIENSRITSDNKLEIRPISFNDLPIKIQNNFSVL